jgi:hypothetical protein
MVSMGVAKAFGAAVDRLVRQLHGEQMLIPELLPNLPGKLLIATGDTYQLAAVMPNATDTELAEGQLHLAGMFQDADVIELVQVLRQNDPAFKELLRLVRENKGERLNEDIST